MFSFAENIASGFLERKLGQATAAASLTKVLSTTKKDSARISTKDMPLKDNFALKRSKTVLSSEMTQTKFCNIFGRGLTCFCGGFLHIYLSYSCFFLVFRFF